MNSTTAIQEELRQLSSSLPLEKQPVFAVPEGYFENFAATVLARINGQHALKTDDELSELSPMLAAIPKKMPYSVPDDYFSKLSADVPVLVSTEEALPDFLLTTKSTPYQVPAGYFENLPAAIMARIERPKARVIGFPRQWMRYAAAAVVTGIIAISSIVYFQGDNNNTVDPNKQPGEWVAKKLKDVSSKALDEFLNTTDATPSDELANTAHKGKTEVRSMLRDVSNKELDAFLEQLPTDNDDLSVIN